MQWGVENEAMGLVGSISDSWTPEQRQQFIEDWMDDEPLIQEGFGKKRSYDEMRDDDSETSTEVRDDKTYFTVTDLKQMTSVVLSFPRVMLFMLSTYRLICVGRRTPIQQRK